MFPNSTFWKQLTTIISLYTLLFSLCTCVYHYELRSVNEILVCWIFHAIMTFSNVPQYLKNVCKCYVVFRLQDLSCVLQLSMSPNFFLFWEPLAVLLRLECSLSSWQAQLLRLKWSSYLSLTGSWDHRCAPPGPANFLSFFFVCVCVCV